MFYILWFVSLVLRLSLLYIVSVGTWSMVSTQAIGKDLSDDRTSSVWRREGERSWPGGGILGLFLEKLDWQHSFLLLLFFVLSLYFLLYIYLHVFRRLFSFLFFSSLNFFFSVLLFSFLFFPIFFFFLFPFHIFRPFIFLPPPFFHLPFISSCEWGTQLHYRSVCEFGFVWPPLSRLIWHLGLLAEGSCLIRDQVGAELAILCLAGERLLGIWLSSSQHSD